MSLPWNNKTKNSQIRRMWIAMSKKAEEKERSCMINKVNQQTATTFAMEMAFSLQENIHSIKCAFLVVFVVVVFEFSPSSESRRNEKRWIEKKTEAKKKQMGWNDKSYLQRKPHRHSTAQNKESIKFTAKTKRSGTHSKQNETKTQMHTVDWFE